MLKDGVQCAVTDTSHNEFVPTPAYQTIALSNISTPEHVHKPFHCSFHRFIVITNTNIAMLFPIPNQALPPQLHDLIKRMEIINAFFQKLNQKIYRILDSVGSCLSLYIFSVTRRFRSDVSH